MADKSHHFIDPLDFHPCETPRGMDYYDLMCLTSVQQHRLNNHKIEVIREHQKFLYRNPEIRAVLQIIMKKVLLERPTHDIDRFIGSYFKNDWKSITDEVKKYVETMPGKPSPDASKIQIKEDKHVKLEEAVRSQRSSISRTSSAEEHLLAHIVKDIVDEMVDNAAEEAAQHPGRVSDTIETPEEAHKRQSEKSEDEDDELIFDLGLDFDLDFSAYHEEDDNRDLTNANEDTNIIATLSGIAIQKPTPQY